MNKSDGFDDNIFAAEGTSQAPALGSPSTVGTLRVKKTDYAIGLIWEAVDDPSLAIKTARERAGNAEFFCVRQSAVTQFGLGERRLGHKANMPSLAAHIAANRPGQFLALFEVPGGYYILGVRHDGIISEIERHVSDRQEAVEMYEEYLNLNWDEKIAPENFGWVDTIPLHIEDCITGRPPVRLKPVKRGQDLLKFLFVGVLIGGGILGWQFYQKIQADEQIRLDLEAQAQAAKEAIVGKEEIIIPPAPWEGKTLGKFFLNACMEQIEIFPLDVPGWVVTGFRCENPLNPVAAAVLSRDGALGEGGGPITWILPYVKTAKYTPDLVLANSGSSSDVQSVQWMLFPDDGPKVPIDLKTLKVADIKNKLLRIFESRMTQVAFNDTDMSDFYKGLAFEFTTTIDPRKFADIVSAIPGSVIDSMDYDLASNTWKVRGNAYEQLPLPKNAKK